MIVVFEGYAATPLRKFLGFTLRKKRTAVRISKRIPPDLTEYEGSTTLLLGASYVTLGVTLSDQGVITARLALAGITVLKKALTCNRPEPVSVRLGVLTLEGSVAVSECS